MHELSLTESILEIIDGYARDHGFKRVNALKLSFGRLSCIDPKALEFAFQVLSRGTRADGARLEFDVLPAVIYCFTCEKNYEADTFNATCPHCGMNDILLTAGTEELKLVELDIDEET